MYNSHKQIIWLTNFLNTNGNRPKIDDNELFDSSDEFIKFEKIE